MINSIIILIIVTILGMGIISYFYIFGDLSGSHYGNYISTLTLTATLIGAIMLLYQYSQATQQTNMTTLNSTVQELQTDWINLEQQFMLNFPYLSRLYQQIYPDRSFLEKEI